MHATSDMVSGLYLAVEQVFGLSERRGITNSHESGGGAACGLCFLADADIHFSLEGGEELLAVFREGVHHSHPFQPEGAHVGIVECQGELVRELVVLNHGEAVRVLRVYADAAEVFHAPQWAQCSDHPFDDMLLQVEGSVFLRFFRGDAFLNRCFSRFRLLLLLVFRLVGAEKLF